MRGVYRTLPNYHQLPSRVLMKLIACQNGRTTSDRRISVFARFADLFEML